MADRAGTAAAIAAAAAGSGRSPPPLPTGTVLARNPEARQAPPSGRRYPTPSSGFENAEPAGGTPVEVRWCTHVCRNTGTQRGRSFQVAARLVTAVRADAPA